MSELMKLAQKNAERLNILNRMMATDTFPTFSRESKDLFYEEVRALNTLLQIQGKQLEHHEGRRFTHKLEGHYPVTIFQSRYNGTYSGGKFIALNSDIDEDFNPDMVGSDVPCARFWINFTEVYGFGNSPDEAMEDLRVKLGVEDGKE